MPVDDLQPPEAPPFRSAVKLLFQKWRGESPPGPRCFVQCEERIVVFPGVRGAEALAAAKAYAEGEQYEYSDPAGWTSHFEFVGVVNALVLTPRRDGWTMWYDSGRRTSPLTRRDALVLQEDAVLRMLERQTTSGEFLWEQEGRRPRFAAYLLFQFRVGASQPGPRQRVRCEERLVVFPNVFGGEAIAAAKSYAERAKTQAVDAEGREVHFEFIGIVDAEMLDLESDSATVWYDVYDRRSPMTRKDALLRSEDVLLHEMELQSPSEAVAPPAALE